MVRAGDDLTWARPNYDDRDWTPAPNQFRADDLPSDFENVGWFRLSLEVPYELTRRPLELVYRHVGSMEVYLDGRRIIRRGLIQETLDGGETAAQDCFRNDVRIEFAEPGRHVLAVRLASTWTPFLDTVNWRTAARSGFAFLIGPEDTGRRVRLEALRRRLVPVIWFAGVSFSVAVLQFFLFFFRRQSREHLHFALACVMLGGIGLATRGMYYSDTVLQMGIFFTIFRISLIWVSYFFLRFVQTLCFGARPLYVKIYLGVAIFLTPLAWWLPVALVYAYSLFLLADMVRTVILAVFKGRPGAGWLSIGMGLGAAGAAVQMIPMLFGIEYEGSIYVYGFVGTFVVVSALLARSYAHAHRDLEVQMERAIEQERRARDEELARKSLEVENERKEMELEAARKREEVLAQLSEANRELRSTQAQLVQSGKMAALGQLVAGVAHEINTPVGAIGSMHQSMSVALERLRSAIVEGEDLEAQRPAMTRYLKVLEDGSRVVGSGSQRVSAIVKRLRTFARLDEAEFKEANLNEGLEDTLLLMQHKVKEGIRIETELSDLPLLPCFPSQLNQVFLNLLVNAVQAIEGPQGRIVVRSRREDGAVIVEVEDNGVGIPSQHLSKIFDPGFTTKGVRVGTGLGLSISYQIVEEHQGRIDVESTVGRGTKFTVWIPTDLDRRLGKAMDS